ncbi:hypothetical protein PZE06_21445 [Robertmurraya sp. DFI.2.37]|uniref:hypothetical protein n=1 Tax=Robertmurraya sp. DFI.2.37 TaxID=3031819 RepID=UPI0012469719|nr:hypothetical protein [Robertmurraya sp. DFI.2.37]MDF1510704.1 hypothetical protein [Robertmurraya sp. DFI.2.37]
MEKIELNDGKYTVVNELNSGGKFYALRHGEEWRSLAGDNLVLAMFHKIEELSEKLSQAEDLLSEAHDLLDDVHCYETETFEAISRYFNGCDDE